MNSLNLPVPTLSQAIKTNLLNKNFHFIPKERHFARRNVSHIFVVLIVWKWDNGSITHQLSCATLQKDNRGFMLP